MNSQMALGLTRWSWGDLIAVYGSYGRLLGEYAQIDKRIGIPRKIDIQFPDDNNLLIMRFWRDCDRVDAQLRCIEAEFARRKQLIGVFG